MRKEGCFAERAAKKTSASSHGRTLISPPFRLIVKISRFFFCFGYYKPKHILQYLIDHFETGEIQFAASGRVSIPRLNISNATSRVGFKKSFLLSINLLLSSQRTTPENNAHTMSANATGCLSMNSPFSIPSSKTLAMDLNEFLDRSLMSVSR